MSHDAMHIAKVQYFSKLALRNTEVASLLVHCIGYQV